MTPQWRAAVSTKEWGRQKPPVERGERGPKTSPVPLCVLKHAPPRAEGDRRQWRPACDGIFEVAPQIHERVRLLGLRCGRANPSVHLAGIGERASWTIDRCERAEIHLFAERGGELVLLETGEGDSAFTDVRFTRDWRRVRCLDPEVDVELLEGFEGELRRMLQSRAAEVINYRGPMSRRDWLLRLLEDGLSNALQITPAKAVLTENPSLELGKLAQMYLESEGRRGERRAVSGRRVIYAAMREAFESAGVWALGRRDIALANYGSKGDPLKIDFGYRPNGVIKMFQAMSLETDVDAAKVLAFSYPALREGLRRA